MAADQVPKVDRFGLNVHHFEQEPAAFPLVAEARVGWVRLAAWWRFMQPQQQGEIDFARYLEPSVDAALANGLKVLIVFASVPGWANQTDPKLGIMDPAGAKPPTDTRFFQDFVTAVVTRFRGRVGHYEIWNEPNYKFFWNGDYNRFINEILIPGAQAVKAADPAAKTLGPCTDSRPDKFKAAVDAACPFLDILSCHLYNKNQGAGVMLEKADAHRQLVKQQCNKPIWVTEFGVDSWQKGEETQAKELAAAFDGLRTRPYLERLFVFEWRDGFWPHEGQRGWGLVSNAIEGFRRKKSFWAVQDLALRWQGRPGVASSPEPADGATNVALAASLSWSAGRGARSHRLSLGTESPSFVLEQQGRTFSAAGAPREHGRTYFWRIDELGNGVSTSGTLWRFTVEEDPSAASAPLIVCVQEPAPFFLGVVQGQGRAECAPARSLVRPDTPGDLAPGAWTVATPEATDLAFLRPAGTGAADPLTITLAGLRPGGMYRIFGRYVMTVQQAARQAGIRLGLDAASMMLCEATTPGVTVVRKDGRWVEREIEIGSARAEGGALQVILDAQGLAERAGWSGVRLEVEPG